ncbi:MULTISPECIES: GNAT family N-acetyltransferase [unclassified Streptomyces]|uniref:GNAT family N-acetyltransferase n=1 Tax=Streptomyces achmelvichensis TaxID=3134111 RepID=A0ACC6Q544_9ACTN
MSEPDIRDNRSKGLLEAYEDGQVTGHIAYFTLDAEPPALVAVHTIVEPEHEGKGIASSLVRELFRIAEREGVPVVTLCPYAARWVQKHPDEGPTPPSELVVAAEDQLKANPDLW